MKREAHIIWGGR